MAGVDTTMKGVNSRDELDKCVNKNLCMLHNQAVLLIES